MKLCRWIAFLVAVCLVITAMPASAFAATKTVTPAVASNSPRLLEQILERDGFIDGIWFPWFDGGRCGHNLTGNDVMAEYYNAPQTDGFIDWNSVELDRRGADTIYRQIYNLKAMGYNIMAYAGSIYGEGVIYDEHGDVLGIKQEYLDNARRLLDMCREIGMPVMWNVYFHCSTTPDYYGIDGWNITCRMLGDPTVAQHYAQRFVKPLCEMLAEYPDVVALVSIADEPENEINDVGIGNGYTGLRAMYGVTQDEMTYFLGQINDAVREMLPEMPRTVASNYHSKDIYRDFDLDYMGHNRYTDDGTVLSVEQMVTDSAPLLTEYNVGGNTFFSDEEFTDKLITFRENMMAGGYKGGFQWCWIPGAVGVQGGWAGNLLRERGNNTSFRKTVTQLKYYMDAYRAEYRGETIALDAPVLYANAGDGKVQFIPSQRATHITIQRSDDGGKTWKTVLNNAPQANYVDEYLIGCYEDAAAPASGYCYRITATDGTHTVTSDPNNLAGAEKKFNKTYIAPAYRLGKEYILPTQSYGNAKLTSFGVEKNRPVRQEQNLITDGSFEKGEGEWNTTSFLQYATVVSDPTTPEGSKSLYFNTAGQDEPGWYTFTVTGLKAHTEYTFSAWLKGAYLAPDNHGTASIGVMDPDSGTFMVHWGHYSKQQRASRDDQQLYPTAWDDAWHLRGVSFNSGTHRAVTIALYGYGTQMWVDGIALFESSNGKKYENGESAKALVSSKWQDLTGSATNAVADPQVNDTAYWAAGVGYRQGFVQAEDGALRYAASADPHGVRYTKWITVKPDTDYYVSFTVNVTTPGAGRVAVLDSSRALPNEVAKVSFSTAGTKTYQGRISTGRYTRLGLCVVDLGGGATIDDICFYESPNSVIYPTEPSYDGYVVNGDFETGTYANWENHWNSNTVALVEGYDSHCAIEVKAGRYTHMRQKIAVERYTDYVVEFWSKEANAAALLIKDGDDTYNIQQVNLSAGSVWKHTTMEFNSGDNTEIYLSLMGVDTGATYVVDDITMRKKTIPSNDGYLINGNFEMGQITGWENLYGKNTVTMVAGHDSAYAARIVGSLYSHVRQRVAVEPHTDYVVELWCINAVGGSLLVKDGTDTYNILHEGLSAGSEWTHVTVAFNSGDNTAVYVSLMGAWDTVDYVVDDVKMYEKCTDTLLKNGGFEEREQGWLCRSGSHAIVTDAHSGNYALKLQNPAVYGEAAIQTIPVEPFTVYTLTWWYKATPGTDMFCVYAMDGQGKANLQLTGEGENYMYSYTGEWQKATFKVKTGDATGMLVKFSTDVPKPGTILIDDVTVTRQERYVCDHRFASAVTQAPTCAIPGVGKETCVYCGYRVDTEIPATGAHVYDSVCDAACDVCGATRQAPHHYAHPWATACTLCGAVRETDLPLTFGGNSISEDVSGLAFRFDVAVQGMERDGLTALYQNATINGYRLLSMGAIATNGFETIDIPAVYLWNLEPDTASYVVRIVGIPARYYDVAITATPYLVLEIDGVATTIYGDAQTCSYNDALI